MVLRPLAVGPYPRQGGQSLIPGGTPLVNGVDQCTPTPTAPNVLREIDLAGNPIRETNPAAVNAQLAAMSLYRAAYEALSVSAFGPFASWIWRVPSWAYQVAFEVRYQGFG